MPVRGEWQSDVLAAGALALGFVVLTALGLKLRDRKV
jgi:ABC transport system ATP-binding/permease protein